MKKITILFFLCSFTYGQNLWKDVAYTAPKDDNVYELLGMNNKESLIINFFIADSWHMHYNYYYLIFTGSNAEIARISYLSDDIGKALLTGKDFSQKDFLKKTQVQNGDIKKMLKLILDKGYLKKLLQNDLDRPHLTDEKDTYIYVPICTGDGANFIIEFHQNNKYYKLEAYSPDNDCDRSREKLNQFIELYRLLENTWDKSNSNITGGSLIDMKKE